MVSKHGRSEHAVGPGRWFQPKTIFHPPQDVAAVRLPHVFGTERPQDPVRQALGQQCPFRFRVGDGECHPVRIDSAHAAGIRPRQVQ